jgi:non-ribosomal peptide synthetase component E (peptide arylation enzyme)
VAFVEVAQDAAVDVDTLRAYLKERLSPYKVPSQIVIMQQLPAAPTGKILKKELQRIAASGN